MNSPLRIGLLGASRIAELAVIEASRETGDVLAAIAARDPERAESYAKQHGIERVHESYEALLADDSLDLIYISLPNGLHAEWAVRALRAGRSVLLEKPAASNLAEFDALTAQIERSSGWVWEAFHYADHPAIQRLNELVRSGEIGEPREVRVTMLMPAPPESDPRWSFELAGGAMMDLGCYAINGLLLLGETLGVQPELISARAAAWGEDQRVDAEVEAQWRLADAVASTHISMVSDYWEFQFTVLGTAGEVTLKNFVKPQEDDLLVVRSGTDALATERHEHMGTLSSYVYQLRQVRQQLRSGERNQRALQRSRHTMRLIDEVYQASGLPLRPGRIA